MDDHDSCLQYLAGGGLLVSVEIPEDLYEPLRVLGHVHAELALGGGRVPFSAPSTAHAHTVMGGGRRR